MRLEALTLQRTLDRMADLVYCPRCSQPVLEDSTHCAQCTRCRLDCSSHSHYSRASFMPDHVLTTSLFEICVCIQSDAFLLAPPPMPLLSRRLVCGGNFSPLTLRTSCAVPAFTLEGLCLQWRHAGRLI